MREPVVLGIGHIALRCTDLPAMERFYREHLGYREVWRPDADSCYLSRGTDNLALHAVAELDRGVAGPLDHFGILVSTADDVDRFAAALVEHGVALEAPPRAHRDGSRSFTVRDPEGNRVQVMSLGAAIP